MLFSVPTPISSKIDFCTHSMCSVCIFSLSPPLCVCVCVCLFLMNFLPFAKIKYTNIFFLFYVLESILVTHIFHLIRGRTKMKKLKWITNWYFFFSLFFILFVSIGNFSVFSTKYVCVCECSFLLSFSLSLSLALTSH